MPCFGSYLKKVGRRSFFRSLDQSTVGRCFCTLSYCHVELECGIALHAARDAVVDVHTVHLKTPAGDVTQKSFDTTSTEIDLLHRIEKLVHRLPGSNIIMTESFVEHLNHKPEELIPLGIRHFAGQARPVRLFLIKSDLLNLEELNIFIKEEFSTEVAGFSLPQPYASRGTERALTLGPRYRAPTSYQQWEGSLLRNPNRSRLHTNSFHQPPRGPLLKAS